MPTAAGVDIATSEQPPSTDRLDEQVSSYDDLFVSTDLTGRVRLECPDCGFIPLPWRETTLSDLTNAAIEHLSEQHPYSLTLPSARTAASQTSTAASERRDGVVPSGYFTDHFWSLIALLREEGAGVEALVRLLDSTTKRDILNFQDQLTNAITLLDTPSHRGQPVKNLDDPLQTVPAAMSDDAFLKFRLAVVASGRAVWLDVLAHPDRLAGGWSLLPGHALLDAPAAAMNRIARTPLHTTTRNELHTPHLTADAG